MLPFVFALVAAAAPHVFPFEIASNKPFVRVSVNGSAPQWFIFDTGNNGPSIVALECADRLRMERSAGDRANIGAGSGADVRLAHAAQPFRLSTLGESLTVADPRLLSLAHVGRAEGHRTDGLIGADFLSRHVVEFDYARGRITIRDPETYAPPADAVVLPLDLETGWPVVQGTVTTPGGRPLPCRLIVDTVVRFTIALFRPFSETHRLYDAAALHRIVIGSGAGGLSRGDVGRLESLSLGPRAFADPVAVFSRDTTGVFALDGPDGIIGGELLRRHRVTFDCPHARMILEPYPGSSPPFEFDMSGMFLAAEDPDYATVRVLWVNDGSPAATAGLMKDDEIVSIDGRRTPALTLDQARAALRTPGVRQLEVRRGGKTMRVRLEARRQV
jgi:hypothetical protein